MIKLSKALLRSMNTARYFLLFNAITMLSISSRVTCSAEHCLRKPFIFCRKAIKAVINQSFETLARIDNKEIGL